MKKILFVLILIFSILASPLIARAVDVSKITEKLDALRDGAFVICLSLAVIMFIVAGIMFLTAAGSPEQLSRAKNAFLYGVIGLLVAILSRTIVAIIKGAMGVI